MYFYSELFNKSINAFIKYYEINYFFNSIYFNSFLSAIKEVNQNDTEKQSKSSENVLLKTWFANLDKEFDEKLRYDDFINLLNNYVSSSLDLVSNMTNNVYLNPQLIYHDYFDLYLKHFYSPFISYSKELNLSVNEIIFQKDNIKLLHYTNNNQQAKVYGNNILLIIYAPINRFHILDLNPSKSVVRTSLSNDIDVYLLDWGYPDKKDNKLTLKDYVDYIDDAVDAIKQSISFKSSSSSSSSTIKLSILGYCWGGITSLIYTALNQKKINKLILMATPVDFSKDNTTVSMWSKSIDTDKIIETFGHFDGYILDYVFNIRNPVKFLFAKYFNLWKNLDNKEFVNTFFDVEKWLHDTPPIPGELYKKIVNDCYKNNHLIKGSMKLDERKIAKEEKEDSNDNKININRITIPVLSIIADKDDLVSPMSSLAVDDYLASHEKKVLRHPGGHISLCLSDQAHKELWPKVSNWIKS